MSFAQALNDAVIRRAEKSYHVSMTALTFSRAMQTLAIQCLLSMTVRLRVRDTDTISCALSLCSARLQRRLYKCTHRRRWAPYKDSSSCDASALCFCAVELLWRGGEC